MLCVLLLSVGPGCERCCFYLGVRKVVNVAVVDLQQSVSILEAAVSCCPSGRHRPDDVTQASPLNPQTEAVGVPVLTVEKAQSRAGGGVCRSQKHQTSGRHTKHQSLCSGIPASSVTTIAGLSIPSLGLKLNFLKKRNCSFWRHFYCKHNKAF